MEIFKYGIKFTTWGEMYVGLQRKFISLKEMFNIIQSEHILFDCGDERLVRLYLAEEEGFQEVLIVINSFIKEAGDIPIGKYDIGDPNPFKHWPDRYNDIWKLELLLRVDKKDISISKKINMAYGQVIAELNYPEDLESFSLYGGSKVGSMEGLYENMKTYIQNRIEYFLIQKENKYPDQK